MVIPEGGTTATATSRTRQVESGGFVAKVLRTELGKILFGCGLLPFAHFATFAGWDADAARQGN